MKKLIKNLAVIAIALFGFAVIGVNLSADYENPYPAPPPGGGGGGSEIKCRCSILPWDDFCKARTGWHGTCWYPPKCWMGDQNC